jgi:myosin heavy subunit
MLTIFSKGFARIRETIGLEEESGEEDEEEAAVVESADPQVSVPDRDSDDGSDHDLDLSPPSPDQRSKLPPPSPDQRSKLLLPYYEAVKEINSKCFPTVRQDDASTLPARLSELIKAQPLLTQEYESLQSLSNSCRHLSQVKKESQQLQTELHAKRQEKQAHLAHISQLEQTAKLPADIPDVGTAEKRLSAAQMNLERQDALNQQLHHKIASLKSQMQTVHSSEDAVQQALEEERGKYARLVEELNALELRTDVPSVTPEEAAISELERDLGAIQIDIEKLRSQQRESEISEIDLELEKVREQHRQLVERRARPAEMALEHHERRDVTTLLVNHYRGDKEAIGQLRQYFGWSEEDVLALGERQRPLGGLLRLFTGFRDLWTSWLIAASES